MTMTSTILASSPHAKRQPISRIHQNRNASSHDDVLGTAIGKIANGTTTQKIVSSQLPTESVIHPDYICRESLYADFLPLVRRLIRQYGTEPELREDLVGEIYYRFCALLDAYDPERGIPLKPYMVRQLTASIYTYARHQWRRQRRELSFDVVTSEPAYSSDPSCQWDDALAIQQVKKALPQAFDQLSPRQRQVVIWRYYEERSFDDIAECLGIQVATARSILRHGLNNIRRRLEEVDLANV